MISRYLSKLWYILTCIAGVCTATAAYADTLMDVGENATVGLYIYDIVGDSIVVSHNANLGMTPASVLKTLTTATAIQALGMSHQFATDVLLSGKAGKKGVWNGDLIIRPDGDPTLESRHFPKQHGLCDSIAAHLQQCKISRINGNIIVADTISEQGQVEKWEIDDVNYTYGAGWYNLNWMDNVFTLNTGTGETTPYIPDLDIVRINSRKASVKRGKDSEKLHVYGPRKGRKGSRTVTATMPYPYKVFLYQLKEKLKEADIEIVGCPVYETSEEKATECKGRLLYTHLSAPSGEIMRDMMWRSDNMFAEGMLRALAPGQSREAALNYEDSIWTERGLDMERQIIYDGSGLTRVNSVTPSFLGRMLTYMAQSPYAKEYASLFPVAGIQGTVRNMLKGTPLEGKIALKSGSVNNVRCYGGYVLDENGMPSHVAVVMVNRYTKSTGTVRDEISRLLLDVLHGHCGIGAEQYDPELDDAEAIE